MDLNLLPITGKLQATMVKEMCSHYTVLAKSRHLGGQHGEQKPIPKDLRRNWYTKSDAYFLDNKFHVNEAL